MTELHLFRVTRHIWSLHKTKRLRLLLL